MRESLVRVCALSLIVAGLTACSVDRLATRTVANLISQEGGSNVFASEVDPQLVAESLPFTLKLHELLLVNLPTDAGLQLATGSSFVTYANAFLQRPAERLPGSDIELRVAELARAKGHYLRGREYILTGIELRHRGFRELLAAGEVTAALALVDRSSIDYLYWLGAASLGALTTDPLDIELLITLPHSVALIEQVDAWDDSYGAGAAHEILLAYYAGVPETLGGGVPRARDHFARAVAVSAGAKASPYLAMALVAVRQQDPVEFRRLLQQALAVELDVAEYRLLNVLDQQHAVWLLDHMEDLFLEI